MARERSAESKRMSAASETSASMSADSFVPPTTPSGIIAADFVRAHIGRNLVIWGAGVLGRCLCRQLAPYATGGQTVAFTDSNPKLVGTTVDRQPVLALDEAVRRTRDGTAFLIVAFAGHTKAAMNRLAEAGLVAGTDYESFLKFSRPEAVIQISGRTGEELVNLPPDTYRAILKKLKAEIPSLFHVDLSGWGDPLDHPDLAHIVEATRAVVPCTLTTRLDADLPTIKRALLAGPTQFVVAIDGHRDDAFVSRLRYVADLQSQIGDCTEIRIRFTRFLDNGPELDPLRLLCDSVGLRIVEVIGYINSYDTVLQLCETRDFDAPAAARLPWSLTEALTWAQADRASPCLCQRIFPVINPDGSVGVCHLYTRPRLHDRYLAVDNETLQRLRQSAAHCRVCQHYALHRLDIDVLQARHAIKLIRFQEPAHA